MLADALAELKKRSKNKNNCAVGNWALKLSSDEQELFYSCLKDQGISSRELFATLGDVPFGKTSLTEHRAGRCMCQN